MSDITDTNDLPRDRVLAAHITAVTEAESIAVADAWARDGESRSICFANAHVTVTARRRPGYCSLIDQTDMALPDGTPVAWMLRRLGHTGQERVDGPDWMHAWCTHAAAHDLPIFLYGSTEETLATLSKTLPVQFPGLKIAGAVSPPFRSLHQDEDEKIVAEINASGAKLMFVALGAPKQEQFIVAHRGRIDMPMAAVGAAFDFFAGNVKRAPEWMQDNGLEWLHRLASEPGRLWKRYFFTNTMFVIFAARQLWGRRGSRSAR